MGELLHRPVRPNSGRQWRDADRIPLYKRAGLAALSLSARSCDLLVGRLSLLGRSGAESGTGIGRSPAQAGHHAAKSRTEQEV